MIPRRNLTPVCLKKLEYEKPVSEKAGRYKAANADQLPHDWSIRDTHVNGLHIRITRGAMTWCVVGKVGGKVLRRSIAHYRTGSQGGQVSFGMDLPTARKIAMQWLAMMARGLDPYIERRKLTDQNQQERERQRVTLAVAYSEYSEAKKVRSRSSTHADRVKVARWMQRAPIWNMRVIDIDRKAVDDTYLPFLNALSGSALRPPWGPASMSFGTLNKLYTYVAGAYRRAARNLGLSAGRGEGPFSAWKQDQLWPEPVERTTFLDINDDQARLWLRSLFETQTSAHSVPVDALIESQSQHTKIYKSILIDFYVCLLLWGTRKTETRLLREEDVDFERGYIRFRPETTKGNRLAIVPMTPWSREILARRVRKNEQWREVREKRWQKRRRREVEAPQGVRWLFPSRQRGKQGEEKPLNNPRSALLALNSISGTATTAHDLRRTLATFIGQSRFAAEDLGRLLTVGATLHHQRGPTGSVPSKATVDYIQNKTDFLRPRYQEWEVAIRRAAGLKVPKVKALNHIDDVAKIIDRARKDPAIAKRLMEVLLNPQGGK